LRKHDIFKEHFDFYTENGHEKLTLEQYHKRDDLRPFFSRQATPPLGRQTLFMGRDVFSFSNKYLQGHPAKRRALDDAREMYRQNPLKYFVPQSNTVIDFLNWKNTNSEGTLKIAVAGVGTGKSVIGCIDWLLDIVPTEEDWPIFGFGINRREYKGPFTDGGVAIVSYQSSNHQNTLWPQVIRRWCPVEHIAPYVEGTKRITWNRNPHLDIAGTPVFFLVSKQQDTAFVSQALNIFHWDEQTTESKFNNANDRVQRRGGRHVMTMTPHYVEGQPETGAGSFIHRIMKKELDTSLDVKFFRINKLEVADWVVTAEDKKACVEEWIEGPMRNGNLKKLAEGKAKVYGEFHERSGLVFDDFNREVHVIAPFKVPKWWTYYRYHDHGRKEPNAAILVAVNPAGDRFIVSEHYGIDQEISDNVRGIISTMTGNEIASGEFYPREVMRNARVLRTVSDPRSLSRKIDDGQKTIGDVYREYGLQIQKGSGQPVEMLVGLVGDILAVNQKREHYTTKERGAPGLYIFDSCVKTIWEFSNYRVKPKKSIDKDDNVMVKEKPVAKHDHIMTCVMLMAADNPQYVPSDMVDDWWESDDELSPSDDTRCNLTGY
jgi:hypothetical protein